MGDRQALLKAILADPKDDAPRLIFADWLDEYGDAMDQALAELIRVQLGFTNAMYTGSHNLILSQEGLCHCAGCRTKKYEKELLGIVSAYTPFVVPNPEIVLEDWEFVRGFVSKITLSSENWFRHYDSILVMHPIEKVIFSTFPSRRQLLDEYAKRDWRVVTRHTSSVDQILYDFWPTIKFGTRLGETFGRWPGTETDEELQAALRRI